MSTLELAIGENVPRTEPALEAVAPPAITVDPARREQMLALVQQLYFRQAPGQVRHAGFAALEAETDTARLCLDVATTLTECGHYDVGLIDAGLQPEALHERLQIRAGTRADASWLIGPRLWLAPRGKWLDSQSQRVWDPSLARLRSTTLEFDFSVLCFDPLSWLTSRLSQTCNGVVMVLTAHRTRRQAAARMHETLRRARVPVLGTILAERRFPVPPALYRNL